MPKRNRMADAHSILERGSVKTESGCWQWRTQLGKPYPSVMVEGQVYAIHRLAYQVYQGPIRDGLCVCHTCDNTRCCNPEHLFLGTHQQNMADMVAKDRGGQRELTHRLGKLTDDQVREILRRYDRGFPPSWIADDFGLATGYVRDIIVGRQKSVGYSTRHHAREGITA